MQLTNYTDFGLRILMYVAIQPERQNLFTISEITSVFELSPNHISKIVHHLGKRGYLETVRGKTGGFRLGMPANEINIGQLVRELEKSLLPVDCNKPACLFTPACQLKSVFNDAINAYLAVLDGYSLSDIVSNKQDLLCLLPGMIIPTVEIA